MKTIDTSVLQIGRVFTKNTHKLLEISRQTFYDSFGPPLNTEKNIQQYLNEKFTLDNITKELKDSNSYFYFAKLRDEIIGYLKLNTKEAQTEPLAGNGLEIERIYLVSTYQGRGIGQFLINEILNISKEKKVAFIWLGVWNYNKRAVRFYERNGFKTFDEHKFMLGSDEQTDLMMKRVLL
ncbi:GNAT family N-acetyltransferase [Aquimarina sp. M1]